MLIGNWRAGFADQSRLSSAEWTHHATFVRYHAVVDDTHLVILFWERQGLGRAAVQLVGAEGFNDVHITYASPRMAADLDTRLLRAMVIKGT